MSKYYCVVYWYTTPLNRTVHRVKNGSARRKANSAYEAAEIRIKEQVTAANSADAYDILHVEDVSDKCETGEKHDSLSLLRTLEQTHLHGNQKRKGMWVPGKASSEWFCDPAGQSVDNVVQYGLALINEWRHGVARPNAFPMRDEQQECHDQVVAHFQNGGNKFLMNAKMRFGKTFTSYQIIKSLNAKRVLVLTYKPAVDLSWREDLESHIDFEDWEYHSAKEDFNKNNPVKLHGTADVEIVFASFQDINDSNKAKWKHATKYHYDLIIIDEMHYGSKTDKASDTLASLNYDKILWVSGTPLKALMSGEFLEEEIYSWSYADEQAKRRIEKVGGWQTELYRWLPEMEFHTFKISEEAKKLTSCYAEEEGFSMTKMFGSDDGKVFNDESAVKLFLDQVFGIGVHKSQSPIRTRAVDHMLIVMPPSVNSAAALAEMLELRVGNQYKIINVAGSNGITNINKVKGLILSNKKTITVTCGRFNTGVTVPEWDMVLMMDDGKSAESYFQTIFRVQSPDKERSKELCTVVDFNPQRLLEMIYEFAEITAKPQQSTQAALRAFMDFAPVMDHSDNKPVLINVDDVLNMMAETGSYAERFGSNTMFNWSLLDDYAETLALIESEKGVTKTKEVNDNGLEKGKNFAPTGKKGKKNPSKAYEKEIKKLKEQAITTMRKLPTYLFLEDNAIADVDEIVYNNNEELFVDTVNITLKEFGEMCDAGFIQVGRLNRCIMSYNQIGSL